MRLSSLIDGLALHLVGDGDPDIIGLTADSRKVKPGFLFAALAGVKLDGQAFIADALAKGAVAILAAEPPRQQVGVPVLVASEPRLALSLLAARFFPRQPDTIVAVTGTSGKTSVASFCRQIFLMRGHSAASLGTLGVVVGETENYGSLTTPDPVDLHRALDDVAGQGVTHLALEASSHGLDQHRLDGVRLSAGAFTNLSHDHLDYHLTVEAYLKAKLRLVEDLLPKGASLVVNQDSEASAAFIAAAERRGLAMIRVGEKGRDLRLVARERLPDGQALRLSGRFGEMSLRLPLVGDFQTSNALVAAGLAIAVGEPASDVFGALQRLKGVKGRLDKVGAVAGAAVYVDYSHKPDALDNVLSALRPYARGKLVVVFGCGGDRDAGKRPLMGRIAAEKADRVIVTDDNPRSEDPAAIRATVLAAAPGAREIGSREEAINQAVSELQAGDILVIAGKGHEVGQIVGNQVLPFSDHEAARAAIRSRGGGA